MISNEFNSHQEKRRPIVLMDHSYGGIVIAHVRMSLPLVRAVFSHQLYWSQALTVSAWREEFKPIYDHTLSIFFFGVPHRGISSVDVVGMVNEEPENQGYFLVQDVLYEAKRITINM